MKSVILILITIAFVFCKMNPSDKKNISSDTKTVKIVLDTEEPLAEQDTIFLTGNQSALGNWQPHVTAMTRRSETRWEKSFPVDSSNLRFKFTLGNMANEAISNRGIIPSESHLEVVRDTEVYFVIEDWQRN